MFPPRDRPSKASPIKIPSKLKIDTSAEKIAVVNATHRAIQQLSPRTRENLTASQVYSIASDARIKLGREADQVNHNLRRLVGHANMLDLLMDELIDSKIKQDDWGQKHSGKRSKSEPIIHVSWNDRMLDELDDCDTDSDTDTDDSEDAHDDDESVFNSPLCRITSHPPVLKPEQAAEVGATIAVEETKQICNAVATLTLMAAEQASTELFPGFTTGDNFKLRAPPVKKVSRVPSIQTLAAPC